MVATTMAASIYAEQRVGVEGVQRATAGANVWFPGCKHGVQEERIGAGVTDAEIKLSSYYCMELRRLRLSKRGVETTEARRQKQREGAVSAVGLLRAGGSCESRCGPVTVRATLACRD